MNLTEHRPLRAALPNAILTVLLAALLLAPAHAQVVPDTGWADAQDQADREAAERAPHFNMRASELIGREVFNRRGFSLGEVQDLFVDAGSQEVHYAVLAFGGVMGLGEKLFPVPMRAFHYTPQFDALRLNVDVNTLQYAPGFERDTWPNYGDPSFFGEVRRFFGEAEDRTRVPLMLRGSALLGRDVEAPEGGGIGEVQDFVVDLGTGEIPYFVLAFDRGWNMDDRLVPLPLTALGFPVDRDEELRLFVEPQMLRTAMAFRRNAWPDLNAPSVRRQVDRQIASIERDVEAYVGDAGEGALQREAGER